MCHLGRGEEERLVGVIGEASLKKRCKSLNDQLKLVGGQAKAEVPTEAVRKDLLWCRECQREGLKAG